MLCDRCPPSAQESRDEIHSWLRTSAHTHPMFVSLCRCGLYLEPAGNKKGVPYFQLTLKNMGYKITLVRHKAGSLLPVRRGRTDLRALSSGNDDARLLLLCLFRLRKLSAQEFNKPPGTGPAIRSQQSHPVEKYRHVKHVYVFDCA